MRAIIAAQSNRDVRRDGADDILLNDGPLSALHAQVDALHQRYLGLAAEKANRAE